MVRYALSSPITPRLPFHQRDIQRRRLAAWTLTLRWMNGAVARPICGTEIRRFLRAGPSTRTAPSWQSWPKKSCPDSCFARIGRGHRTIRTGHRTANAASASLGGTIRTEGDQQQDKGDSSHRNLLISPAHLNAE
jgi:hypothetical protein